MLTFDAKDGLMMGRRIVVGLAAALMGLAGAVAMPAEASAAPASVISSNSGGANLRECADSACRSFGYLRNGTTVYMQCWVDGGQATGNYSSPRWFSVLTPALGAAGGYVHSSLVANQIGVPHC